jgi:hypothetical protein
MEADTPINLANLTTMTPEERETLVTAIRERRMQPVLMYEEMSLMQAQARKEGLEKKWSKTLEMFLKDLASADKALDRLQKRNIALRVLEMEIESI